ncbi:MAG: sugar phosphate nucleotidyltransferase [Candidatus Thermoplasmatota archaeon]|jgi:glucose-1-phosphate thymidylyltransferase|nr:sugar phosphate nucleotidyltransferase [Candidatus Thermoplasmatota archaeon]
MKAVILAAGEGKRLRPFTETMPKVMLPVANKPILEHVFNSLKNSGVTEIILVVGYKKEVIMEYFKDYKDIKITYVVQDKQLGTADALSKAKNFIKNTFVVIPGDNIIDKKSIINLVQDKSDYCALIKEHPHPSKYGVVFLKDKKIKEIVEKPSQEIGRFISTGIYKLTKSVFKEIDKCRLEGVYDLSSVIQRLIEQGKTINTIIADSWMDIVYPWDLIYVNENLISSVKPTTAGVIEKGVTIKGNVIIGKDTKIHSGCYIVGPVVIGEGCEIGPNVCIFPSTTIGNNTVVNPFTEIRNSVIMEDVHIGSNSFITHSIIARGTLISDHFSNILGENILEIEDECKKVKNIGVMIGEDCTVGCQVVAEAGIIIGRKCKISALKRLINNIPSETKVM